MLIAYMAVEHIGIAMGVVGIIIWLLLRRAENAAAERSEKAMGERSEIFFRTAKIACVVLVFIVEFFLQVVLPQAGKEAIDSEYGPPSYVPYSSDP
jgi:hypothetical protein